MSLPFKPPDEKPLSEKYAELKPLYERLIEEIRFILEKNIDKKKIKIHTIQARIKSFNSFHNKVKDKKIMKNPLEKIDDIAGIRIICLYRSDLERMCKLISEQLDVIEADEKTRAPKAAEFGYMADHYVAKLPDNLRGPRYDDIKPLKCEIQVRTILMDAWSSISHHLEYKQETDIPFNLKKDFYALSGLFYVADTHFEMLKESREKAIADLMRSVELNRFDINQEINMDSLRAYLEWKMPKRGRVKSEGYSELVTELGEAGYTQIRDLDEALNASMQAHEALEKEENVKAFDVGVVRLCLDLFDESYRKRLNQWIKEGSVDPQLLRHIELIKKYASLVKAKSKPPSEN